MKVVCKKIRVDGNYESAALREYIEAWVHLDELPLDIGKCYTVYALLLSSIGPSVFIVDAESDHYPMHYHLHFFDIEDASLSKYWQYGGPQPQFSDDSRDAYGLLTFPEWSLDKRYYELLVDGDEEAKRIFVHYKELMDREAQ